MLVRLINVPVTQREWAEWSFHHRESHNKIRQAIQAKHNISLPEYVLDPIYQNDVQGFLQRNSQTHIEMDQALGVESNDLLDVDLRDQKQKEAWVYIHYLEHYWAETTLGV